MSKLTKTQRNLIQVTAFRSIYKANLDLSVEERFLKAIVATSDEALEEAMKERPELIEQWAQNSGIPRRHLRKKLNEKT